MPNRDENSGNLRVNIGGEKTAIPTLVVLWPQCLIKYCKMDQK